MLNINKFHNIHEGETCYIFGDGPSIKYFDLKTLVKSFDLKTLVKYLT